MPFIQFSKAILENYFNFPIISKFILNLKSQSAFLYDQITAVVLLIKK